MKTRCTCYHCGKAIPELPASEALCVRCRYHVVPEKTSAIESDHPEYEFAVETLPAPNDVERDETFKEFEEGIARFLMWLGGDGDVISAGRKGVLLAFLCDKTTIESDADLARRLNISPGRISQIRQQFEDILPGVARCNRRQIKARPIGV